MKIIKKCGDDYEYIKKIKEGGTCKTLLSVWGVEGICFIEYDYVPMIYIVWWK